MLTLAKSTQARRNACLRTQRKRRTARRSILAPKHILRTITNQPASPKVAARKRQSLPHSLPRPPTQEVKKECIEAASQQHAPLPPQFIRNALVPQGIRMLTAISNTRSTKPLAGSIPRELEIIMNDKVAASCPTHMLALYSSTPSSSSSSRKVTLLPSHSLVLAAHCANLPALPPSFPSTSQPSTTLPMVPICIPSVETFPILQAYLYTKRTDCLIASLLKPCSDTVPELTQQAQAVAGLWRNAYQLGVVDTGFWDSLDYSWANIRNALDAAS